VEKTTFDPNGYGVVRELVFPLAVKSELQYYKVSQSIRIAAFAAIRIQESAGGSVEGTEVKTKYKRRRYNV
jgi:hypothetical protein